MKTQVSINIPIWMILVIVVILFIFMLIRIYNRDKGISKKISEDHLRKDELSLNWIEKKDLLYWLIIICLGTISIFTFKYREASEVINHWGFAGTIISIILAVLAIIYTYYQSATTLDSTKRLERSAKKVTKATTRVEEVTKELEDNNVRKVVEELEEKLNNILSNMQNDFKAELQFGLSSFSELLSNNESATINFKLSENDWKNYLEKNIINRLTLEGLAISYIYYLYKNNLLYNIDLTKQFLLNLERFKDEFGVGGYIIQGQIRLFKSLNIIDYGAFEGNKKIVKFTTIDPILQNEMEIIFNEQKGEVSQIIVCLDKTFKGKKFN